MVKVPVHRVLKLVGQYTEVLGRARDQTATVDVDYLPFVAVGMDPAREFVSGAVVAVNPRERSMKYSQSGVVVGPRIRYLAEGNGHHWE